MVTIVNTDGHLRAYNTDYLAIAKLLADHQIPVEHTFAVLGSGGMAKAANTERCRAGAHEEQVAPLSGYAGGSHTMWPLRGGGWRWSPFLVGCRRCCSPTSWDQLTACGTWGMQPGLGCWPATTI